MHEIVQVLKLLSDSSGVCDC